MAQVLQSVVQPVQITGDFATKTSASVTNMETQFNTLVGTMMPAMLKTKEKVDTVLDDTSAFIALLAGKLPLLEDQLAHLSGIESTVTKLLGIMAAIFFLIAVLVIIVIGERIYNWRAKT